MHARLAAAAVLVGVTTMVLGGCLGSARPFLLQSSDGLACTTCRMAITEVRFAAQVVGAADAPLFFDDIACLAKYLDADRSVPKDAQVYVADYRTGEWVDVHAAVYARDPSVTTPMSSHLLAFRTLAGATASASPARTMVSTVEAIGERWVMSTIIY